MFNLTSNNTKSGEPQRRRFILKNDFYNIDESTHTAQRSRNQFSLMRNQSCTDGSIGMKRRESPPEERLYFYGYY